MVPLYGGLNPLCGFGRRFGHSAPLLQKGRGGGGPLIQSLQDRAQRNLDLPHRRRDLRGRRHCRLNQLFVRAARRRLRRSDVLENGRNVMAVQRRVCISRGPDRSDHPVVPHGARRSDDGIVSESLHSVSINSSGVQMTGGSYPSLRHARSIRDRIDALAMWRKSRSQDSGRES